jgi:hypothetical protein
MESGIPHTSGTAGIFIPQFNDIFPIIILLQIYLCPQFNKFLLVYL